MKTRRNRVAIVIPCYNEEITIAHVIKSFQKQLPHAQIYVFDNNSTDSTARIAEEVGATVIKELRQGKGFVNQAFMEKIDADIYVTVDGDGTYPVLADIDSDGTIMALKINFMDDDQDYDEDDDEDDDDDDDDEDDD